MLETAELLFDGEHEGQRESEAYSSSASDVRVLGSLRRDDGGPRRFLASLAEAWTAGVEVDWGVFFEGGNARTVRLPTYAFQRDRYWLEPSEGISNPNGSQADAIENRFWEAIENADVGVLAGDLRLDEDVERSSLQTVLPALSASRRRRREESVTAGWRYRVGWKRIRELGAEPSGSWIVLVPEGFDEDPWLNSVLGVLRDGGVQLERIDVNREG